MDIPEADDSQPFNMDVPADDSDIDFELSDTALDELRRCASFRFWRRCTEVHKLASGGSYEVFIMYFAAMESGSHSSGANQNEQWSCLARVSQTVQPVELMLSEVETMRYIKSHTTIPIPEVYFHDFDASNTVGAQYMFIERLSGRPLDHVWEQLSLDHKKSIVANMANIFVQLSALKFDSIGSLKAGGEIGPLLCRAAAGTSLRITGPFTSTLDYFLSHLPSDGDPESSPAFSAARQIVESYISTHSNLSLSPPFRIIHEDLADTNILVTYDESSSMSPVISGLIDWEYAHTGPSYFFYDYPIFIQDSDEHTRAMCADNKVLRQHFSDTLYNAFPKDSPEHTTVLQSMDKNFTLNGFMNGVIGPSGFDRILFVRCMESYVESSESRSITPGRPYEDRFESDSDDDGSSSDEFSSDDSSDDEWSSGE
jgi:hypothetical protein